MTALEVRVRQGDEPVVFRDSSRGHRDGKAQFVLSPDGCSGLESGTDTRREETSLPQAHGSFDAPGFRTARIIDLSGNCIARTPEDLVWAGRLLTGLLADGGVGRLVVERESQSLWTDVRLASKTQFAIRASDPCTATFQIQFWAADPRLYGDTRTFVSGDAAYHFGNFPADPVITVTGSSSGGYTINGPDGGKFVVTKALVSGHPHIIDMATGFLSVDGVVVNGGVSQADLWTVPGGASVVMTASGVTLSIAVTDTSI